MRTGRGLGRTAATAAVVASLVACGGDAERAADDPVTTSTTSTTSAGTRWVTCENPEAGYSLQHPPDWETNDGDVLATCSLFDPDPIDVPRGTEIPLDLAVVVRVDPVPLSEVEGGRRDEVRSREESTVAGRDAVRVDSVSTGEALRPAGTRTVQWLVDVDGRTLFASTHSVGEPPFDRKVEVLDRMVETLTFDSAGSGASDDTGEEGAQPVGPPTRADVEAAGFDRVILEFRDEARPAYQVRDADDPVRLVVDLVHRAAS